MAKSFSNCPGDEAHMIAGICHHGTLQVALVNFTGVGATKVIEAGGAITVGWTKHVVWRQDMKHMKLFPFKRPELPQILHRLPKQVSWFGLTRILIRSFNGSETLTSIYLYNIYL